MYCADSTVYHVGGGTLNKTSTFKTFLNFRNNLVMISKNHPTGYFYSKLFIRLVLDGLAGIKFLASGQFGHFTAVIKAHFNFYASLGKTLKKRKQLKKLIKKHTTTTDYKHSIIADYYFRGKKKFTQIDF